MTITDTETDKRAADKAWDRNWWIITCAFLAVALVLSIFITNSTFGAAANPALQTTLNIAGAVYVAVLFYTLLTPSRKRRRR